MKGTEKKDLSLAELIELTKGFVKLADELYQAGKLSQEEYDELTYLKKDFLIKAEISQKEELERYL